MTYTLSQGSPGCRDGVEFVKGGSGREHHVASTIQHWQLRDLLCCPERREEVYYVIKEKVAMYHVGRREHHGVLGELPFEPTSMATGCGYVAAGGGRSQLVFKSMDGDCAGQTSVGGSINNAMEISQHGGEVRLLISNNDETIKVFSLPSLLLRDSIRLPTAVNYASVSPDGSKMVAVGDSHDVFLFEIRNNAYNKIATLKASNDSSFSCAWSHASDKFAVASQDGYVSVWDVRSSHKVARLSSKQMVPNIHLTGACRNVKFSPSSSLDLLVFTEHTSYAHVVDARTFNEQQILKLPSSAGSDGNPDISGVCFSPDAKALFIGTTSTIMEYDVDAISRRSFPQGSII